MNKEINLNTLLERYPDVMNATQVRQFLRIGRHSVYHLLETNQIPCFKVGNAYKVPKTSLIAYIERCCKGGEQK